MEILTQGLVIKLYLNVLYFFPIVWIQSECVPVLSVTKRQSADTLYTYLLRQSLTLDIRCA